MADLRKLLALSLFAAAPLYAQLSIQISDPANLTAEHVSPQALADTLPINHGAPALEQLLVKLRTRASMMLIVAHPDDEDGGFLTYESRGQGARAGMLTLNRGEGGQNLMTGDFDDALGLIRTQELLAADRYMGVDQFFGTMVDFGFSKTKEESFQKWTHDRVLYDAVRCVRLYRPLILASVFVGGVTDGHGQHQVAGEITQEVFLAAADPKVFPEMGLPPWAPLKVYARSPFARIDAAGMYDYATGKYSPVLFHNYVTGADITHAPTPTVLIHEGDKSTLAGMGGDTYQQFARKGLALQKSQNGGLGRGGNGGGGVADSGYTLMGSRACEKTPCPIHSDFGIIEGAKEQTPFDGIDTTLHGIATLAPDAPLVLREKLLQTLADLDRLFASATPTEQALTPLHTALTELDSLLASVQTTGFDATQKFDLQHELRIKRVQLNRAILLALGVTAESVVATPARANLNPGKHFIIHTALTAGHPLTILSATLRTAGPTLVTSQPIDPHTVLSASAPLRLDFEDRLPANTPFTRPAFSRTSLEQPFYNTTDAALRNAPAAPYAMVSHVVLRDELGDVLEIESAVAVEGSDDPHQPAVVVPPVSIALAPSAGIFPAARPSFTIATNVAPFLAKADLPRLTMPPMWTAKPENSEAPQHVPKEGTSFPETWRVSPANIKPGQFYQVRASVSLDEHEYSESYRPIGYPGLTLTNMYAPAIYKATALDATTAPNLRIAYLPGTGDDVPAFLPNLGVTPAILSLKDLTPEKLSQFDEVILGVRAYSAHPELVGPGSKPLLDYARNGGIVILQYNNGRFGPDSAPYAITTAMSSGDHAHDVVVEAQPVEVLVPKAPLLTWPNKITSADFDNWVAERGHGFAGSWAPEFTALLETHDPDQDPQKGGLLVAPVGKGAYIYCGLALYRQLPEGVPGAYRLMANLLSYAKNPNR